MGVRAWADYTNGRYDEAERLFRAAIAQCADTVQKDELILRYASLLYNQGGEATELLEHLQRNTASEEVRADALGWLPAHYARKGEPVKAKRALDAILSNVPASLSSLTAARTYLRTGIAALALELDAKLATKLFTQANEMANRAKFYSISAAALSGLSNIQLIYEDDPQAALPYALASYSSAHLSGDRFHIELAMIRIAHLSACTGDRAKLLEMMETLRRLPSSNPQIRSFAGEMLETAAAWDGDFELALQVSRPSSGLALHSDRLFVAAQRTLYFIATRQRDGAVAAVGAVLQELSRAEFSSLYAARQAECARLLCAIAETGAGRRTAARQILRSSAVADAPYVRTLKRIAELYGCGEKVQLAPDGTMRKLLDALHVEGRGGLALVLEHFFDRVNSVDGQETALTPSELEVLQKLDSGFAPKQIAAETGRSVHTVRTLVQRAVTKLGCSGRQEALAAARRAGLLDPDLKVASGT